MKDIYLCLKCGNSNFYNCSKFDSFEEADSIYSSQIRNQNHSTVMLDVNSFIPSFLHKHVLNFKLRSMLVNVKIKK